MRPAVAAHNFRPTAISIRNLAHGSRNGIVKTWPTRTRLKLIIRTEQRSIAPTAKVYPRLFIQIIFASKRHLRSLILYNPLLVKGKIIIAHAVLLLCSCSAAGSRSQKIYRQNQYDGTKVS